MSAPVSPLVTLVSVLVLGLAAHSASAAAATRVGASPYAVVDKCGDSDRLCLAYPDNCVANKNCELVVTVRRGASDKYVFEMAAQFTGYVSVALAESTSMGVDSVVECVNDPNQKKVAAFQSVNKALNETTKKRGNSRLPADAQLGVTLTSGTVADGVISCSFERDRVTTVKGKKYDLETGTWVLQAAAGDRINADTSVHHHLEWVVSPDKVKLSDTGLVAGSYGSRRGAPGSGSSVRTSGLTLAAALLLLAGSAR